MNKELQTQKTNDTELMELIGDVGHTGFEDSGVRVKHPYLTIVSQKSTKLIEVHNNFVEGLKAGYFVNSQTGMVYGKSVKVIPISRFKSYKEVTQGKDPKFVRIVPKKEFEELESKKAIRQDGGSYIGLPSGNLIKQDINHIYLLLDHINDGPVKLSLSVGHFTSERAWVQLMLAQTLNGKTLPICFTAWELTSVLTVDKTGINTFFSIGKDKNPSVKNLGRITNFLSKDEVLMVKSVFEQFEKEKEEFYNMEYSPHIETISDEIDSEEAPF